MPRPDLATVPAFYHSYVNRTTEEDVPTALRASTAEAMDFFQRLPDDRWAQRYAEGKWSIKEMVQHLVDADRIFCCRALCFARGEKASLPGFDEDAYAAASDADRRTPADLLEDFETVRKSAQHLFRSFGPQQLAARGVANNNAIGVEAIGFIMAGHLRHHLAVLRERYL